MAEVPDPNDRKLGDGSVSHFQRTQLAMGECQECKTIRTNLDNITRLISSDPSAGPTWFAQKLEEKAFISNAAGAVVTGLTKYEQVGKLIGAVKDKISISQEPEKEFAKFIEILQSNPPLLDLAKKLLQDCGIPVHRLSLLSRDDSERESIESPREKSHDDAVFSPGAESVEGIDHPRVFGCGCGDCTFANVLERGCPQATVTVSGLPFLDTSGLDEREKDDLVGKLLEDSRRMMFTFQKLVSKTCTSLEQRGVTPKQLVDRLIVLGPLDPVLKESGGSALHKGLLGMRKADTVGDVFFQIRDYMSFFNYDLLDHIVKELGTDDDKAEVDQYKDKLRDYCRRRAVECPPLYGMPSKSGHVRIVVKLDKEVEKYTVAELKLFQRNLSRILNLKEYALCLISVDKGCLELTFQMPSFLKQKVFPLSYKQEEALKCEGVVKVQCEEYHIPAKEQTFDRNGEGDLGDGAGTLLTYNTTEGTPPPPQPPHQPHGRYTPPKASSSRQAGYDCEFVDPPPEAFQTKCPICLNILCDPHETDCCANNFCRTCIERVQEDDRKSCPMCKKPVTMRPNTGLKRSLKKLHVRCTHQQSGCDWVGELGELDRHLNSIPTPGELLTGCEYNEIECEFSYAGCETQLPRKEMAIHMRKELAHHLQLLTMKMNVVDTNMDRQLENMNDRLACVTKKLKDVGTRLDVKHCEKGELTAKLQSRNEEIAQVNKCIQEVTEMNDKELEKLSLELDSKDKELEKLSFLIKEKDEQISYLKKRMEPKPALEDKSRSSVGELAEPTVVQKPIADSPPLSPQASDVPLNYCFTIENFESRRKHNEVFYCEPFYTHPQGYKLCAQVYPNGFGEAEGTHVTVSTCVMRGKYDDQLSWPFRGEILVQILDQTTDKDEGHHEGIISYNNSTSNEYAGRKYTPFPKSRNSGWGSVKFISHRDLQKYLKDDCLRFRIRDVYVDTISHSTVKSSCRIS